MIQKTILFFALLFTVTLVAQKQQASPYSFFGIGNNFLSKTVEESMMGGVGAAISDPVHLNFSNPAAQSKLRFTTYALGVVNTLTQVSDGANEQRSSIFSLSYLAIGVPMGTKGGFTAGLRARTGVGYNLFGNGEDELGEVDPTVDYTFEGSGGASSLFVGGGYELFKGFSLGAEAAFIFGEIENVVTEEQASIVYDTREKSSADLRGFETKLGMYYEGTLKESKVFSLGLTVGMNSDIDITETSTFYKGVFSSSLENIKNTLEPAVYYGTANTPLLTTFAIGYGKTSVWQSSVEVSFHKPQSFEGDALKNNTEGIVYGNYQRLSAGGYYIPKYNSLTSYFHRIIYRAGVKYENTGLVLNGTEITDIGISFGVGLPLGKGLTDLNIGAEYGVKGEVVGNLVEEKYFNVRLSLSLGDKWFRKRKID